MNWDQIESKWAAMTRRIRADWAADRIEMTRKSVRPVKAREGVAKAIAESRTAAANDPEFTSATK